VRTLYVFLGGVLLSIGVPAMLEYLLGRNDAQLIARAFTTAPTSPQWGEIWDRLQHAARMQVYVLNPLGGLAAGAASEEASSSSGSYLHGT
jgi:hypothetical protein